MADVSKIRKFRDADDYRRNFVVQGEIDKYLPGGKHFIDEAQIARCISEIAEKPADPVRVREIIAKSESTCATLLPEETAVLMSASSDPALFEEMCAAAGRIKKKVYDNRIVVFAPLYMSNLCVNGYGVGCILPTSKSTDGVRTGYDLPLIEKVRAAAREEVDVVASGGAGTMEHFAEAAAAGANVLLAASVFHFHIIDIPALKSFLKDKGFSVRG